MSRDVLDDLREALATLESQPLADRPGVLDRVHRELVADLDALGKGRDTD
jgi:hypothetical protein